MFIFIFGDQISCMEMKVGFSSLTSILRGSWFELKDCILQVRSDRLWFLHSSLASLMSSVIKKKIFLMSEIGMCREF